MNDKSTVKTTPQPGPPAIKVTPEGSREVDPMSIIGSDLFKTHLNNIRTAVTIVPQKTTK